MKRFGFLSLLFAAAFARADIRYGIAPDLNANALAVRVQVEKGLEAPEFVMPVWCPGFYVVQNFSTKVYDVRATDEMGKRLKVDAMASSWKVENPSKGFVTFTYKVQGDDPGLGFFAVHVDSTTTYINGPGAFVYLRGHKNDFCHLTITKPQNWEIATSMDYDQDSYLGHGYDDFADHPIQLGIFERRKFSVNGIPFELVVVSGDQQGVGSIDDAAGQIAQLAKPALKMMGSQGFKRYLTILHLVAGNFSGGLEHRASHVEALQNPGNLISPTLWTHEFFHSWNVKQIRPKLLGPFDYTQAVRTPSLWFAEGVTDYYAKITAYRAGYLNEDGLLDELSHEIGMLQASNNRLKYSLADASMSIWEFGGVSVGDFSYYNKGQIAGLVFDAAIRGATDGRKSLDDVMRLLWTRYRLPQAGYEESDLMAAIDEVAGVSLDDLYRKLINTTDDVPYDVLQRIGLKVSDMGGFRLIHDSGMSATAQRLYEGWISIP
ncbi:MAG: M61 family metallopeptidase [Armatimonadetes bacterium]|nr:M61 family metallopeptidase [Armatimonadota bacterium]